MNIEGVIFDLDGTLLDSTWVWSQIDIDFLGERGFEVPPDYAQAIISMGFEDVAKYTIERFGLKETVEDVMAQWDAMAQEAYANKILLKPGVKEFLLWLKEQGIKMGIATSNSASLFVPCLKRNGIYELFHSYTETGDVTRGKEFPDVYIKQAQKLSCEPKNCIVFEDIIPALKGAKSGGFCTVGVREKKWGYPEEQLEQCCDGVISDFYEAIDFVKKITSSFQS